MQVAPQCANYCDSESKYDMNGSCHCLVPSRRNQNCQGDTARPRERCSIEKHGPVTNIVPQQSSNDAPNHPRQSYRGVVPANSARAQMLRHEVGCECLAHSSEYSLVKTIEDKQNRNHNDISTERKPKIS